EAEAPQVVGGQDARQEATFLLVAAVGDDRWPGDADAEAPDYLGRACPRHLLDVGKLRGNAGVTAAVLARPVDADPAGLRKPPLPGAQLEDALCFREPGGVLGSEVLRHVGLEPCAQLPAEGVDTLLSHGLGVAGTSPARRAPRAAGSGACF